jgi:hypothetical protein
MVRFWVQLSYPLLALLSLSLALLLLLSFSSYSHSSHSNCILTLTHIVFSLIALACHSRLTLISLSLISRSCPSHFPLISFSSYSHSSHLHVAAISRSSQSPRMLFSFILLPGQSRFILISLSFYSRRIRILFSCSLSLSSPRCRIWSINRITTSTTTAAATATCVILSYFCSRSLITCVPRRSASSQCNFFLWCLKQVGLFCQGVPRR